MSGMEELLRELSDEKRNHQGLPPGFRFHPTDEELITFYLASKVFNGSSFSHIQIAEVDLNRCEPWDLPDVAKMGEREWYMLSLRDKKYPSGLRTNRATEAGYWKATGKDRQVYSASSGALLGMKKTLVFYKGRAPRGEKTRWVMHEYRLDGHFSYPHTHHPSKEEWVICRVFHKSGEKRNPLLQVQGASQVVDLSATKHTPSSLTLQDRREEKPFFYGLKVSKTGNADFWQYQQDEINDNGNWRWMDTWNLNQNCLPTVHNNMDMDTGLYAEMSNLQQHMLC